MKTEIQQWKSKGGIVRGTGATVVRATETPLGKIEIVLECAVPTDHFPAACFLTSPFLMANHILDRAVALDGHNERHCL